MRQHPIRFGVSLAALAWVALLIAACGGAAMAPAPEDPRGDGTGEQPGGLPGDGGDGQYAPLVDSAFIVRTGTLSIEVAELPAALAQAQNLVAGYGGYISGSNEGNDGYAAYAEITYRVPVERWFDALAGLRALGTRVLGENTEAADVTAEVVDLDARLTNLRAAETQYQAILAQATSIDDVLKVQKVLNDTRGEIEQLQAQRDNLANRAALATLTVTWQVPSNATSTASQGWDLGREVDRAFAALVRLTQGLATVAIWLGIAIVPIVVPLGLVAWVGYRIYRRRANRATLEARPTADG